MLVAVRVDPGGDARGRICHGGHRHPFIEQSVQGGRTCRDGGQDRDEPPRQAPMRSRSPDRCVPDGLGGAADRSEREQPEAPVRIWGQTEPGSPPGTVNARRLVVAGRRTDHPCQISAATSTPRVGSCGGFSGSPKADLDASLPTYTRPTVERSAGSSAARPSTVTTQYLNNYTEQSHRGVKQRYYADARLRELRISRTVLRRVR